MNSLINKFIACAITGALLITAACSGGAGSGGDGGQVSLQGAGASFPKPIYIKWMSEYGKVNKDVRIDYESVGSGAGQRAILAETADLGASDDPMKDEDLKKAKGELLHIPTVLGAVVLTYNLEGVKDPLKLSKSPSRAV